jgi:hypothetical protein
MATRHEHGHTPAAWTAVLIILAGIFIGAFAVAVLNWPLFWIGGVGVIVLGLIVGKVMQMMGLGKPQEERSGSLNAALPPEPAATTPEGDR